MRKKSYLKYLIEQRLFRFDHLKISDIDNEPAVRIFSETVLDQEICLFDNKIFSGDEYCRFLHNRVLLAMQNNHAFPVVRFADGEYSFYSYTLACNGLYEQAESVKAIKHAMPQHISALRYVAAKGFLAPLVFPQNSNIDKRSLLPFFLSKKTTSAADFIEFIYDNGINLESKNHIPFYVVYAYLSSAQFARSMNEKNVCVLNSEYNTEKFVQWFERFSSHPKLSFVDIPDEYVATRWENIKSPILNKIPSDTELCLVGAGVGALLICKDVAESFSIPAIDAGHILNMMNDRVDKSNGARLYTLRKTHE